MDIGDGLECFRNACLGMNFNPLPLIVKTARWVDPITYDALPVWYPETARKMPMYSSKDWLTQYTNKGEPKFEPNIRAGYALWQALGVSANKKVNGIKNQHWTVCHIWGIDDPTFQLPNSIVQNPMYYSNVGNMVLLPSPIKAFTDCVPEIKTHLRVCAWYLYGFICDEEEVKAEANKIRNGFIPENYPEEWPRQYREKLPPGTMKNNSQIQKYISNRKMQIKKDLNNSLFEGTHYPKERILSVLQRFPGNDPNWWAK
jgi:hypothetical protein